MNRNDQIVDQFTRQADGDSFPARFWPRAGDELIIRGTLEQALADDSMDFPPGREQERFLFPVAILAAQVAHAL